MSRQGTKVRNALAGLSGPMPRGTPLADKIAALSMPEPNSGCLLWLGSVTRAGYGKIYDKGRTLAAHRVSYELSRGPIPEGLLACHKCDNTFCINPLHIFPGTHLDNSRDAQAKGRLKRPILSSRAARWPRHLRKPFVAKLTPADVLKIRQDPRRSAVVCLDFGVARNTINDVRARRIYRHVEAAS